MADITNFSIVPGTITGLQIARPKRVADHRGAINELFRASAWREAGVDLAPFQQINLTETVRGAVRGLHAEAMTKLVTIAHGEAFGVYVDLRPSSPTSGAVDTVRLQPGVEVLVPEGVGNGFQAVSDPCLYLYFFDDEWRPGMAGAASTPLDPALGVTWPIPIDPEDRVQISEKDAEAPTLADLGLV